MEIISISIGKGFSIICTSNGKLYLNGTNDYDSCFKILNTFQYKDNTIIYFENNESKDIYRIENIWNKLTFTKVACGSCHVLALTTEGQCYSWGWNKYGQLGYPTNNQINGLLPSKIDIMNTQLNEISAGETHSIAIDIDGSCWSWGNGTFGQLGNLHLNKTNSISYRYQPKIIKYVINHTIKEKAPKFLSISCGWSHNLLISDKRHVYSFGWGLYHQLGNGKNDNVDIPTFINYFNTLSLDNYIKEIACGIWHSAAITNNGDLYTWGWGKYYQLGLPSDICKLYPTQVHLKDFINNIKIIHVSCSPYKTVILNEEGIVCIIGNYVDDEELIKESNFLNFIKCIKSTKPFRLLCTGITQDIFI